MRTNKIYCADFQMNKLGRARGALSDKARAVSNGSESFPQEIKMKIRRRTVPGITLAILMLAFVSACSQPAANTNGAGTAANANTTKPAATTTPATTAAAPPTGALSTPTNTFMAFYEASKKNDVPGVIRILSKDSLDFLTAEAKKENKSLEAALTESLKTANVPQTAPETRNEKIDGDKATLEVKAEKTNDWDTFNFVKENNEWKLRLGME
jgi:hypothetical protein